MYRNLARNVLLKKINLLPRLQPEFYCGWKMLVVVDPDAHLASISLATGTEYG